MVSDTMLSGFLQFQDMEDEEPVNCFIEGVPQGGERRTDPSCLYGCIYFNRLEYLKTPFIELFWRKTGADCDGEEDEMEFPNGKVYTVVLHDTRKN